MRLRGENIMSSKERSLSERDLCPNCGGYEGKNHDLRCTGRNVTLTYREWKELRAENERLRKALRIAHDEAIHTAAKAARALIGEAEGNA